MNNKNNNNTKWGTKRLGEIGTIAMCKRIYQEQTSDNGDIPFYKIGTFGKKADAFISKELFEQYKQQYRYPQKGDVLISAAGTIGRTVIFDGKPSYFQDSNIVWLSHNQEQVLNEYLYYAYQVINWNTENTTIARLYNDNFNKTPIPLPPLTEQRRIATILSDMDALIAALDSLIAKKQNIKTATMQRLLTGKQRLKGFVGEWTVKRLGDCAEMNSGGTPTTNDKSNYGGNIPFLSISDITNAGKFINSTEKTITQNGLDTSSARMFPSGTIMFAMYASIGKCAITKIDVAISQAILGVIPNKTIDNEFLYFLFTHIQKNVATQGQTGTQSNLSKKLVSDFKLSLPPTLSEQVAIASVLSAMDLELTALQARRAKYEAVKRGAMQGLFGGGA